MTELSMQVMDKLGTRFIPVLAAILLTAVVLRVAAVFLIPHQPESDELAYLAMAESLAQGEGIVDNMGNRALYNVGYPVLVLAPLRLFFGDSLLAVKLVNAALGCLAVLLCALVAKECGAGPLGRLLAAGAWAAYLPASVYSTYVLKEGLMAPLMLGALWCCLRLRKEPRTLFAVAGGLCFGVLALVGNSALALLGVAAAAVVLAPTNWRGKGWLALIGAFAIAVLALPWLARNEAVVGEAVLNTNGGFNLYLGNNPSASGMFVSIADTPMGAKWPELLAQGEARASRMLRQKAIEWIAEDPVRFAALSIKKACLFWSPPTHSGKGPVTFAEKVVRGVWLLQFVLLTTLAVASLFLKPLRNWDCALLWLGIALYTAVHMVFYVIFRYREPIMPLVCILAAMAVEQVVLFRTGRAAPPLRGHSRG